LHTLMYSVSKVSFNLSRKIEGDSVYKVKFMYSVHTLKL